MFGGRSNVYVDNHVHVNTNRIESKLGDISAGMAKLEAAMLHEKSTANVLASDIADVVAIAFQYANYLKEKYETERAALMVRWNKVQTYIKRNENRRWEARREVAFLEWQQQPQKRRDEDEAMAFVKVESAKTLWDKMESEARKLYDGEEVSWFGFRTNLNHFRERFSCDEYKRKYLKAQEAYRKVVDSNAREKAEEEVRGERTREDYEFNRYRSEVWRPARISNEHHEFSMACFRRGISKPWTATHYDQIREIANICMMAPTTNLGLPVARLSAIIEVAKAGIDANGKEDS